MRPRSQIRTTQAADSKNACGMLSAECLLKKGGQRPTGALIYHWRCEAKYLPKAAVSSPYCPYHALGDRRNKKPQLLNMGSPTVPILCMQRRGHTIGAVRLNTYQKNCGFFAVLFVSCIGRLAEQEAAASEHGKVQR